MNEPVKPSRIALHGVIPRTATNGPGIRYGIWVQGCTRQCPGCINPKTFPFLKTDDAEFIAPAKPGWASVTDVIQWVQIEQQKGKIEGISISGGEPFEQPDALLELIKGIRALGLSILVFTGFTLEELQADKNPAGFFDPENLIDVLVDGPYNRSSPVTGELRSSENQRIHLLTHRYTQNDLVPPGSLECIVQPDGSVQFTGLEKADGYEWPCLKG